MGFLDGEQPDCSPPTSAGLIPADITLHFISLLSDSQPVSYHRLCKTIQTTASFWGMGGTCSMYWYDINMQDKASLFLCLCLFSLLILLVFPPIISSPSPNHLLHPPQTHTHPARLLGCWCYATQLHRVLMWSLRNISYSSGILMSCSPETRRKGKNSCLTDERRFFFLCACRYLLSTVALCWSRFKDVAFILLTKAGSLLSSVPLFSWTRADPRLNGALSNFPLHL